ncbi:uncharacterized protein Dana_GF10869 [Drosophila ananassae]|uniref:Nucleotide exchange factor Fes1 domain-containing protein n=1 Tax=Drosophila ananassae TaxID=7217 RepID=B3M9D1_DROAN|nr:hsp70 nucleotide exchange factor FES1 [Drosophila ananassae]EDV41144.1 uncharacterized protein Dana_GF10869 [Drosophila ananassae]
MSDSNTPRGALSLQNVLKYTVQHHDKNGTEPKENETPDVEKSKFLEEALTAMTTDASKELKAALIVLEDGESSLDEKKDSFEVIRSHIDDLDNANSLVKLGGNKAVLRCIKDEADSELRISAIETVAEMAQNNIFCQNALINDKFLPELVKNLSNNNENIVRSSIYAISSLIRNFEPGYKEFKRVKGIKALVPCLKSSNTNLYIKAAFLIASLTSKDKSVREDFVKAEVFPVLLDNLKPVKEFDVKQETTLFALSSLSLETDLKLSTEKRKEALATLEQIISKNKQSQDCEDMVSYARSIVDNLNGR